ncbi:hypothetical protein ACS0TY_009221 [Phlomoides rotata]
MEVTSVKRGSMTSKLIMSFYRAAKPPPTATMHVVDKPRPASLVKTTPFGDGYVHGLNGGSGDEFVDNKATSYIFHAKERRRLEESNLIKRTSLK